MTDYDRILGLWFDFCYCEKGSPKSKPSVDDYKLEEHDPRCQFRIRAVREMSEQSILETNGSE